MSDLARISFDMVAPPLSSIRQLSTAQDNFNARDFQESLSRITKDMTKWRISGGGAGYEKFLYNVQEVCRLLDCSPPAQYNIPDMSAIQKAVGPRGPRKASK